MRIENLEKGKEKVNEDKKEKLVSILLDQVFPVEYELDEFNTPHTGTTFSRLQYWLCRLRCKIPLHTE